ncbi:MAG: 50S ribosomal protein L19 [Candidatus Pacebacteria bacterium]|nr:50S ribosomal protein L19 [Candidatus Paceibacterota bacterium]
MGKTTIQMSPVAVADRKDLPIRAGATVKVYQKIEEKGKIRLQVFEGLVLGIKGGKSNGSMFTVRKTASGVGVERIFPLYSPSIDKIEIVRQSDVRRAKLSYLRAKTSHDIRRKMRHTKTGSTVPVQEGEVVETEAAEAKA